MCYIELNLHNFGHDQVQVCDGQAEYDEEHPFVPFF